MFRGVFSSVETLFLYVSPFDSVQHLMFGSVKVLLEIFFFMLFCSFVTGGNVDSISV